MMVAAIFKRHCRQCHGESKQEAGLDLSTYATIKKGSSGGQVVIAGRAASSRIVQMITADDPAERMPPHNDALPAEQIAKIKAWIDTGFAECQQHRGSPNNEF